MKSSRVKRWSCDGLVASEVAAEVHAWVLFGHLGTPLGKVGTMASACESAESVFWQQPSAQVLADAGHPTAYAASKGLFH